MTFFARTQQMALAPGTLGRCDSNMEAHAIMKHGISSLLGPGLAAALLLGSGCILLPGCATDEDSTGEAKDESGGFPRIAAKLRYGNSTCLLPAGQTDVTCSVPVRAGEVMQASVDIEWGELTGGSIVANPTCGGPFVDPVDDGSTYQDAWHAPLVNNMACEVWLETSTDEGPFASARMFFSVVDGQPPGEVYGAIHVEHTGGFCLLLTGDFSEDCSPVRAGERTLVYVDVGWGNYEAGNVTVSDDCGGAFTLTGDNNVGSQSLEWKVPSEPTTCTLELEAITAGGARHVFELKVPVS